MWSDSPRRRTEQRSALFLQETYDRIRQSQKSLINEALTVPILGRLNRFRQVVVHTVLVGRGGADRRFLEDLAHLTGGHFVDASAAQAPAKRR